MDKYYGIFKVCIDSRQGKDALRNKKTSLFADFLEDVKKDQHRLFSTFFKAERIFEDRNGNEIKCALITLRQLDAYDDKYRRSHRFKTRYFIHETDEYGWLKLSKKEIAEAQALLEKRREREASAAANLLA